MAPDQYLGWLALALTPGLGARMTGKLLRAIGIPEAIFNASLTGLESHRLPPQPSRKRSIRASR